MSNTYFREFETTEAFVSVMSTDDRYSFRVQRYRADYSLPHISTCVPTKIVLDEQPTTKELCNIIEEKFSLTNCYDLNDWRTMK